MKYLIYVLVFIASFFLISIGFDKFLNFIEPPCSVMNDFPPIIWKGLGVIQIIGGLLIWIQKFRNATANFFIFFMLSFTIYHLTQSTYDIGGSSFMILLYLLIIFLPKFQKN